MAPIASRWGSFRSESGEQGPPLARLPPGQAGRTHPGLDGRSGSIGSRWTRRPRSPPANGPRLDRETAQPDRVRASAVAVPYSRGRGPRMLARRLATSTRPPKPAGEHFTTLAGGLSCTPPRQAARTRRLWGTASIPRHYAVSRVAVRNMDLHRLLVESRCRCLGAERRPLTSGHTNGAHRRYEASRPRENTAGTIWCERLSPVTAR